MSGSNPWDFSDYARSDAPSGAAAGPPAGSADEPLPSSNPTTADGGWGPGGDWTDFESASGRSGAAIEVGRPPVAVLGLCLVLGLAGGVVGGGFGAVPVLAIVGWMAAGPVAIGLLGLFMSRDTRARSGALYASPSWLKPGYVVCVVVLVLAVVACALRIAFWVGRR